MKFPFEIVSFQGRHSVTFFRGGASFTMKKMLSSRLQRCLFSRLFLFQAEIVFLMVELGSINGGSAFQITMCNWFWCLESCLFTGMLTWDQKRFTKNASTFFSPNSVVTLGVLTVMVKAGVDRSRWRTGCAQISSLFSWFRACVFVSSVNFRSFRVSATDGNGFCL